MKRHGEFSKSKFTVGKETPGILEIAFGLERPTYCLIEESLREEKVKGEKKPDEKKINVPYLIDQHLLEKDNA